MNSILDELYMGNLDFDFHYYDQNSPFVKAAKKKLDCKEKLMALLDDNCKELLEEYIDAQSDMEEITRYQTYLDALKFGVLFMHEIFTEYN